MNPSSNFSTLHTLCKKEDLAEMAQGRTDAFAPVSCRCTFSASQGLDTFDLGISLLGNALFYFPNFSGAKIQRAVFPNLKYFLQAMQQEKFSHRQLQEYAFKVRLSRFYIHLILKSEPNQYYYGAESCTLQRIVNQKLEFVKFCGEKGLQNCKDIAGRYQGRYSKAIIYQRQAGQQWEPVIEYEEGKATIYHLPKPAPTVTMRVVHNALEDSLTFQQAA